MIQSDPKAVQVYKDFIDALNNQDMEAASHCVNIAKYRENCVAYTKGIVNWEDAKNSMDVLWKGIPDLHVDLLQLQGNDEVAIAVGIVAGKSLGRLYGAPATKRFYEASFFDYVRIEDGLIVDRIQQADVFGQMRQLYGRGLGLIGLSAIFLRQPPTYPRFPKTRR